MDEIIDAIFQFSKFFQDHLGLIYYDCIQANESRKTFKQSYGNKIAI